MSQTRKTGSQVTNNRDAFKVCLAIFQSQTADCLPNVYVISDQAYKEHISLYTLATKILITNYSMHVFAVKSKTPQ